jgi:tetratricopeptide (TPR) repeat protein
MIVARLVSFERVCSGWPAERVFRDGGVGFGPTENKFAKSVLLYTKAIDQNSNSAVYFSNRAFAHTKLENYGAAVEDATKAIEVDPEYLKVGAGVCLYLIVQTAAPGGRIRTAHPLYTCLHNIVCAEKTGVLRQVFVRHTARRRVGCE